MKKYLLGIVGLLALTATGPAGAADMPLKAPALAPVFDWNRCYVGGHVGYGWGRNRNDFGQAVASGPTENFEAFPAEFGPFDHNTSGGVAGVQAGCNRTWGNWLIGIEGEAFWTGMKGSFTAPEDSTPPGDPGTFSRFESRNLWDIDLAVRLGMLFNANQDLLYVKGGGVLGRFRYTEWHDDFPTTHSCPGIAFVGNQFVNGTCSVDLNQTVPGWLVGFGWEHVISIPASLTFKAEVDFIGYPSHNVAYPSAPATMQQFAVTDSKVIFKVGVNKYFP
jgi:outer membrane immunogenic protein